jgi:hypothetical protein
MNNIIDQTTMTTDAIFGTTLEVVLPSGQLKVRTQGITSSELAANSVKTISIEDANVTPAKLSNSDFGAFTVASGVATLDADVVTTAKILNANVTAAKLDGAQTGSAPIYGARAWASFDGFTGTTATIKASGNIATVVRNSVGRYTVTFTTAMTDANYAVVWGGSTTNSGTYRSVPEVSAKTTTGFVITFLTANNSTAADQIIVDLVIFR